MATSRLTLLFVFVLLVLPLACGNDDGDPVGAPGGSNSPDEAPIPELVCPAYDASAYPEMAPFVVERATFVVPVAGAFSVSATGSPRYDIPIDVPPGRRLTPNIGIVVDNGGASVAGLPNISRCGVNLAQDDQIRGVILTPQDKYCFNGSRLVVIGTGSDSIGHFAEYRTWPDSNTKILGYGATAADGFDVTYFVAYSPNGTIAHYGKSANARVMWRGVTRSWNIEREMDRRGNTIWYDYANQTNGAKDSTTREAAIRRIAYTGFVDENDVLLVYLCRGQSANCNS
jgi:Salmonella virulence plasmid 65kDa B protein